MIILAALFLSVGIFAATNLQKKVSDLTLANIEAMTALGDEDDPVKVPCCTVIFNAAQVRRNLPKWNTIRSDNAWNDYQM